MAGPSQLFDATGQQFKYTIAAFYRLKDTGVSAQQRIANGRFMEPTDQAQVTIITCWPPTSNTHRLVLSPCLRQTEGQI